jgi:sulfoxide reductase catalytic subunit YedY
LAEHFRTNPWEVKIGGAVAEKKTFDVDALMKLAPMEDRVYRHRCVEGWSMMIPWVGFPLSNLINQVQPTLKAKYVMFTTLMDLGQFPGQRSPVLDWPYTEGLRMDEAMHPLTLLTFGIYGETLPNQDGAPVRLVVPWKYGFKSIKSIVKIDFVGSEPPTAWNKAAPNEYGFYSNVNPNVDHPRWSQATERRLDGTFFGQRIKTLMFNGYEDQVATMYNGMDLKKHF